MGLKIVIVVTDRSEEDEWYEVGEEGEGKLSRRSSVVGEGVTGYEILLNVESQ